MMLQISRLDSAWNSPKNAFTWKRLASMLILEQRDVKSAKR